jgi:hypothetical protein
MEVLFRIFFEQQYNLMDIKMPEVITCECTGEYFSEILVLPF